MLISLLISLDTLDDTVYNQVGVHLRYTFILTSWRRHFRPDPMNPNIYEIARFEILKWAYWGHSRIRGRYILGCWGRPRVSLTLSFLYLSLCRSISCFLSSLFQSPLSLSSCNWAFTLYFIPHMLVEILISRSGAAVVARNVSNRAAETLKRGAISFASWITITRVRGTMRERVLCKQMR